MVRVRFAPSPTGFLHVGGARTALFNYLFARNQNGAFILRIEDTDLERSTKESEISLLRTMKWLGIHWDEGPDIDGPKGPYRQSERLDIYRNMAYSLVANGKAYEAYILPEELETIRGKMLENKESPHYSQGIISQYDTPQRRAEFADKGWDPVIYFKMPQKEYVLHDRIKGTVTFKEGTIGDFVIFRSTGVPIYNFAVVVDDALMEITHVIRGDDHLSNTLRQLALYEAYGMPLPEFAHVSMILGPDGSRLSKRHGATAVENFREMGYVPESLLNYLALLGWTHGSESEITSLGEMIRTFSLDRVSSNPAIFDAEKLRWMNGVYIRQLSPEALLELSIPFIVEAGYITEESVNTSRKWFLEAMQAVQNEIRQIDEIPGQLSPFFTDPIPSSETIETIEEENLIPAFTDLYKRIDSINLWDTQELIATIKATVKETKVKAKSFYHMLRIILTGKQTGPELVYVIHLLGRNKMLLRLGRIVS
jgi:nondiscriminating glutamyl-tRNA synthetase